jgi:hypothetical protein
MEDEIKCPHGKEYGKDWRYRERPCAGCRYHTCCEIKYKSRSTNEHVVETEHTKQDLLNLLDHIGMGCYGEYQKGDSRTERQHCELRCLARSMCKDKTEN